MDPFTVNADLSGYSADEITELQTQGAEALRALLAIENPTDADADEAERINGELDRLDAYVAEQATAAAARAERMAALGNRFSNDTDDEAEDEEVEDEEDEAEVEASDDEAEEAAVAPVVAAARRTSNTKVTVRASIAGKRPKVVPKPARNPLSVVASADVPDRATGSEITDMASLATATLARMRGFPSAPAGIKGASMQNFGVAQFRREFDPKAVADGRDDMEAMAYAANEKNLPGGSLVAAGGWCAPSETLYDFCFNATAEGLVSLPEVQANRGGVRFTTGPDFATLYTSTGFNQTEAQAIAGTAKSCYEVTCPTFTEVRLDVIGLCIKVPILTNAAYPELIQSTISQSLLAHQHRVSAYAIGKMVTASGSAVVPSVVGGVTVNTLDGLELSANVMRQTYRLPFNAVLEGVAPFWLRSAIRADLSNRTGVEMLAISDSEIDGYLASRNIRLQWVYNWQSLNALTTDEGYPTTAQVMLYPSGTFVKAVTDVINLSAVYDAASLNVNTYTGLFMEEGIAVFKRCWASQLITLNTCASGVTGAANVTACFAPS